MPVRSAARYLGLVVGVGAFAYAGLQGLIGFPGSVPLNLSILMVGQVALWGTRLLPLAFVTLGTLLFAYAAGWIELSLIFSGFGTESFFFLVAVFYLSQVLMAKGTLSKLVRAAAGGRESLPAGAVACSLPPLILLSASVLPSSLGRAAVIKSLYEELGGADVRLRRYALLLIGNLSSIVSRAFLSGGPGVVLIAGVLEAAGYGVSWGLWLRLMGLPVLVIVLLTGALHLLWLQPYRSGHVSLREAPSLDRGDGYVLAVLLLLVAAWVTGWPFDGNAAAPALVAAVLLSFPWAGGAGGVARLRDLDWETLVFAGLMLSVSRILLDTGAARYLGELLLAPLARIESTPLLLFGILLALLVLRLPILGGQAYSALVFPIVLGFAGTLSLRPLTLAFLTALAGGVTLLPTQSLSGMVAWGETGYTLGESLVSGLCLFAATVTVLFLIAIPLWGGAI